MNLDSQQTLRRIEQNDETMIKLQIGYHGDGDGFSSNRSSDFSQLGVAIGRNTHLRVFGVDLDYTALKATDRGFYDGLKHNTSINELNIDCNNRGIIGEVGQEILKSYQDNSHLTRLSILLAIFQNGEDRLVATTMSSCANLKQISIMYSNISDEHILPIVQALTGHSSLETLTLSRNRIGNAGCETIATLLEDPNCNIHTINLGENHIGNVGATALINSLANNTTLRNLYLQGNPIDPRYHAGMLKIIAKLICNTASIRDTYSSNHTLEHLVLPQRTAVQETQFAFLRLNEDANKSHVAMKKILKYHLHIDMEPFFEWNTEGEGERDLKALPYIMAWFERAKEAVAEEERESLGIEEKKLSAMYQFSQAMPLLFVSVVNER